MASKWGAEDSRPFAVSYVCTLVAVHDMIHNQEYQTYLTEMGLDEYAVLEGAPVLEMPMNDFLRPFLWDIFPFFYKDGKKIKRDKSYTY